MKIMEIPSYLPGDVFLKLVKLNIIKNIKKHRTNLNQFFNRFSEEDVRDAINSLGIVNNYIKMPSNGYYGEILRSLEYGTSYMKAYHIISQAVKEISR